MTRVRADQLLVQLGLVESRARAQALILAGLVFSGEARVQKAGQMMAAAATLEGRRREHPWVWLVRCKLAPQLQLYRWAARGGGAMSALADTVGREKKCQR